MPSRKLFFRLNIGNLLDHLTEGQLIGALVPPGVMPVDMHMQPLKKLLGRPEQSRHVIFEFDSLQDWQTTFDWVKAEAVPGGRIATFLIPNTKVDITPSQKPKNAHAAYVAPSSPKVNNASPPASPAKPTLPASFDPLPEASPELYRLHISNLKPGLELAEIIPALVPQDVKLAGASLFAPRPMGGSRRELVRSLKFAFHTEPDAKRCQQWIKKDSGGAVANLVLPGAKLIVGNPMDPMLADAPPPLEAQEQASFPPTRPPSALPAPPSSARPHLPARAISPASAAPTATLTPSKQPHISIIGINPAISVPAIFSTILGSLKGPIEPSRMGIRNADGRRGAEFVFDSEATAKQFVLQVWTGIKEGKYARVTAEGEELKIVKGRSGQSGREQYLGIAGTNGGVCVSLRA